MRKIRRDREATIAGGNRLGRSPDLDFARAADDSPTWKRLLSDIREDRAAEVVSIPDDPDLARAQRFNDSAFAAAQAERKRGEGS